MRVKKNFWFVFIILIGLVLLQRYIKDPSVERSIYFILTLLVLSALITVRASENIFITRTSRERRQQVGQNFVERYEVENIKNLPILWATIVDDSNLFINKLHKVIAWLPSRAKQSFVYQNQLNKRGIFTLGPTRIITGDPFGFFSKTQTFNSIEKIVILPKYQRFVCFPEPSGFLAGGSARKTRNTEVSPYAISVRDYVPGDPLRRIDWKSTAKLDKLMVKEFEEDPQSTVWVFVDGDDKCVYKIEEFSKQNLLQNGFWQRNVNDQEYWFENSFEQEISIAASICDYYIHDGRYIGFYSNGQKNIAISPEGGVRQLDKLLEMLASLHTTTENDITGLLLSQSHQLGNGSTIIIVSSNTSLEFIESIRRIQKRNITVILASIDPTSFDPAINTDVFYSAIMELGIKFILFKNGHPYNEKNQV